MYNRRMHTSRILIAVVIACMAGAVYGRGNRTDMTVTLKFTPQEGVTSNNVDLPLALIRQPVNLRVEDARKLTDPLVIGHGTGGNDKIFPIHADSDVIAYVQETVSDIAKQWSVNQDKSAGRTLTLQLLRFDVDESNKAVGSVYTSDVKFAFVMKDARGKTLAEGTGSGSTHRYGKGHSGQNCNEVLSDALKEAFANVMSNGELQSAWAAASR